MKKVLFSATLDSHILHFHIPYLKWFKDIGYEVHVATNTDEEIPYCDVKHKIGIDKRPFKLTNLKAISELKKIIEEEKFDIIHTHTPMGSVVTRLAATKARKNGTKVIYTAHGFHFYKGASIKNWLLYYPVEKYLSGFTDILITINEEDYNLAKKKFMSKRVELVDGVGVDPERFKFLITEEEKNKLREEVGCDKNSFVLIFPAELSKRKNQIMIIEAMRHFKGKNVHVLLPGKDLIDGEYQRIVKETDLDSQIHFLGYRADIVKLLKISDVAISTAKQEGLPINILETIYCGLPVIATDCRGNKDLVSQYAKGHLISINDVLGLVKKIEYTFENRQKASKEELEKFERYNIENCLSKVTKLYID